MLKLKVIACDVLNREISYLSSQSKCFVDVTYLHQGLHCTPDQLRDTLSIEIEKANEGFPYNHFGTSPHFDYIIMGYGLCSNGILGIKSSNIPLVIPKGHDCVTLLLGSKERYKTYFDHNPGTYWYSAGWIERSFQPSEARYHALYKEYEIKYGEDNAAYLMSMEQSWFRDYKKATYIHWDSLPFSNQYKEFTETSADFLNWEFEALKGDDSLLSRILNGVFLEHEVLVVPPQKKVIASYDDQIISFI